MQKLDPIRQSSFGSGQCSLTKLPFLPKFPNIVAGGGDLAAISSHVFLLSNSLNILALFQPNSQRVQANQIAIKISRDHPYKPQVRELVL